MSGAGHDQRVPLPVLWGAGALMVLTMALAASARGDLQQEEQARTTAPVLAERMLRFEDRPDGAIVVIDDKTGAVAKVLEPQGHGFVRGIMRSMFRGRMIDKLPRDGAFRLAREADGLLTITDPLTGRRVDLMAFGSTNPGVFIELLGSP